MRKLYFSAFFLLFITAKTFAQTGQAFYLNKLSKQDTLLNGWKFWAGDNPQWANPDFDDSKWQPVDPGKDIKDFSQLTNAGIGWIRLHIKVDSNFTNEQFSAWISQYTASEVYLNGKLLVKYGSVSADPVKVIAYLPSREPFSIKLIPGANNLVAVRLAYQPDLPYLSLLYSPLPAFSIYINNNQAASDNYRDYQHGLVRYVIFYSLIGGTLLIICFIYLVYFLTDRSQKVNLYYALLCLMLCVNPLPNEIWGIERFGSVSVQMWISAVDGFTFVLGMLFLLMTVYTLFNYHNRLVFKILVFIGVVSAGCIYIMGTTGFVICIVVFPVICLLEGAYVCIWAIKQRKKDAAFILAGIFLFIVLSVISPLLNQQGTAAQITFQASLICFPIGMSFYLGVQNSLTNKKLRSTLNEVQTLSAQNLLKEQEKQQILANQNVLLETQVNERTSELNQSLTHLKQTQTQLIQSEKMASLGELTAGIAHEIQNPLNFVNNFSEVSVELLEELKEEAKAGRNDDVIAIAEDLSQNLEKISHHGKRADAIVKGMLQHSQSGSGTKELTNINNLADECMRLAYHGLRAKDKAFNAEMLKHFDETLPKINVIPQDIVRVMLNLFNNAFYTVNEKTKVAGDNFKPEVSVTTSTENGYVIIKVKDNGIGIPDAIKDKIMQPFFTTKPTGEGTGLGLSLTYDMVVKGHGGAIDVNSIEGEGSEFIIALPSK